MFVWDAAFPGLPHFSRHVLFGTNASGSTQQTFIVAQFRWGSGIQKQPSQVGGGQGVSGGGGQDAGRPKARGGLKESARLVGPGGLWPPPPTARRPARTHSPASAAAGCRGSRRPPRRQRAPGTPQAGPGVSGPVPREPCAHRACEARPGRGHHRPGGVDGDLVGLLFCLQFLCCLPLSTFFFPEKSPLFPFPDSLPNLGFSAFPLTSFLLFVPYVFCFHIYSVMRKPGKILVFSDCKEQVHEKLQIHKDSGHLRF